MIRVLAKLLPAALLLAPLTAGRRRQAIPRPVQVQ
jgi:hypothetical protein